MPRTKKNAPAEQQPTVAPIRTVNDLMDDIQHEIAGIKTGEISEPNAPQDPRGMVKTRLFEVQS